MDFYLRWYALLVAASVVSASLGITIERRRRDRRDGSGFSVIELCIGMLVLMVLMALSLPNVVQLTKAVSAKQAAGIVRQVAVSEGYFQNIYQNGFASTAQLSASANPPDCDHPNLLPPPDAQATQYGYTFTFAGSSVAVTPATGCASPGFMTWTFTATANAGGRNFYTDQTGITRYSDSGPATASSPVYGF